MQRGPTGPLKLAWVVVLVGWSILVMASCENIKVVEQGSERTDLVTVAPAVEPAKELHDLAITAIDFDPPLSSSRSLLAEQLSLLAVVENQGNQVERLLVVQAKLYASPSDVPLVQSEAKVDRLVPGESKVVRIQGLPSVPVRSAYKLDVSVVPVAEEVLVTDNTKTYRIEVSRTQR